MTTESATDDSIQEEIPTPPKKIGPFTVRRWLVLLFFAVLVLILMQPILDPYGADGYMEVPHGDHSHYVPRDRDPNVNISSFPTSPPGPNERMLPNGQIVPR